MVLDAETGPIVAIRRIDVLPGCSGLPPTPALGDHPKVTA